MNNYFKSILTSLLSVFIFTNCAESAELAKDPTFREDFSSEKPSSLTWGYATFSMYKFKGDPEMVWNSSGINYLRLGQTDSDIYPSGFIFTREHFYFGSYSARMRVSDIPGAVASFFTCTGITDTTMNTMDEIDFEFITAKPHAVMLSTWAEATGYEGKKQTPTRNSFLWEDPSFDIREWHVYRFDWYSDRVDFYIDGIKRWTSTTAVPQRPMQIALHIYTIDTWEEVQFPPGKEVIQMNDWVEYRQFEKTVVGSQ